MVTKNTNNYETIHEITFFDPDVTGIWSPMKLEVQVNTKHPQYTKLLINDISINSWLTSNTPELMEAMLKAIHNHTKKSSYSFIRVRVIPEVVH
jgi:hypothetical protein